MTTSKALAANIHRATNALLAFISLSLSHALHTTLSGLIHWAHYHSGLSVAHLRASLSLSTLVRILLHTASSLEANPAQLLGCQMSAVLTQYLSHSLIYIN